MHSKNKEASSKYVGIHVKSFERFIPEVLNYARAF